MRSKELSGDLMISVSGVRGIVGKSLTPSLLASEAVAYKTRLGSGPPKVGAPDCIDTAAAKVPKITGAPGLTS